MKRRDTKYKVMYQTPFYLRGPVSNNAFSFDRRSNKELYVPSVINGSWQDVAEGENIVFEEVDETGILKSCRGLRHFIRARHPQTGKPMIIVDNHNHAFYFWHEAREQGFIKDASTLVHIDAHKDARIPDKWLSANDSHDLQKVFDYTNSILNVGNYIPPAMKDGLVSELISITGKSALHKSPPEKWGSGGLTRSLILNIDLDFWASSCPPEKGGRGVFPLVRAWMAHADLITIATSPFFIEQKQALEILNNLVIL